MKNILRFLVPGLLAAWFLAGCATPVAKMTQTPSGKPEVNIATSDVGRIKSMIIGDLVNHGYTVETDTEYSLVLGRKLTPGEDMAAALLLGNSYSSNSRSAAYTFVKDGSHIRVICSTQVRSQMPLGQMKTAPLDDNGAVFNTFQQQLIEIKGKIEAPPVENTKPVVAASPTI